MTNQETMQRGSAIRTSTFGIRLRNFDLSGPLAHRDDSFFSVAPLCLTTFPSAFAIGGVDTPPAPSATHETKFATPRETRLDNGLRVIVAERPGLPAPRRASCDPQRRRGRRRPIPAGTASLTGSLLTKGTDTMSAPEIASAIESLGGSIDSGAGWDASAATLVVISNKADEALKILADTLGIRL